MKRILVPVDGSETSARAVRAAIQAILERSTPPELFLLTVQAPILSGNVTRFFTPEAIDGYYQDEGRNALVAAKLLLDDAGIEYQDTVLVGHVAQSIASYAEEHGCDHIIMGTRGLGSVTSVVLGSVTTKVLSLVKVPVTLIP